MENQSDIEKIFIIMNKFMQSDEYFHIQEFLLTCRETLLKLDDAIRPYLPQIQMALETIQKEIETNPELKQWIYMHQQLADINFEDIASQNIEPLPKPIQPTQDIFELSQFEFSLFLSSLTAIAAGCNEPEIKQIIYYLIALFSICYLCMQKS